MIQITLVRHAKVLMDNTTKLKASQMRAWVEEYDHAPIDTTPPSDEIIVHIKNADMLVASTLSRTVDSLAVIGLSPAEKNALFNEAEIPHVNGKILRFRPKTWLVILRFMMLVGMGNKSQSLKASKSRVKEAGSYLVALSKKHEHVVLMGHGGMNWLIHKALLQEGWELEDKVSSKNWGMIRLIKKNGD